MKTTEYGNSSVAYGMGLVASEQGQSLNTNPFKPGGQFYVDWEQGYRDEKYPPRQSDVPQEDVVPAGISVGDCVTIDHPSTYGGKKYFGWVQAIIKMNLGWSYRVEVWPGVYEEVMAKLVQRFEDGEYLEEDENEDNY